MKSTSYAGIKEISESGEFAGLGESVGSTESRVVASMVVVPEWNLLLPLQLLSLCLLFFHAPTPAVAQSTPTVPYTLTFVPAPQPSTLPALHSYCLANVSPTQWLILGGRLQGLHQFNPSGNFAGPNTMLWSVNPVAGTSIQVADLSKINPSFGDPLTATNQQCEYHPESNAWYIVGGYGLNHATGQYTTFPTIIRIPVSQVAAAATNTAYTAAQRQAAIATIITNPVNLVTNNALRVTGGALSHTAAGLEFLAFGQDFEGNYNPFGSFTQTYTNQVQPFVISTVPANSGSPVTPPAFSIKTYDPITSSDSTMPWNRRDFASGYDVDPQSGLERYSVFGGVFPPGKIAAYDFPVYITGTGVNIAVNSDHTLAQHFGFYEAPIIAVWDGSSIYHTFFGGIGHFFLNQTPDQSTVYKMVTAQGRNDGMPFIEDISTLIQDSSGQYQEVVSKDPIPGGVLHGASVDFVPNLSVAFHFQGTENSVVNLSTFTDGEKELIGYIYGGIEATFPLPCYPSHGTLATNTLYSVYLTKSAWANLVPASSATEATGIYPHNTAAVQPAAPNSGPPVYTPPNPCATAPIGLTKIPSKSPKKPIKGTQK